MTELLNYIYKDEILKKCLNYVFIKNESNLNTYHNFNHLLTVSKYCLLIGKDEKLNEYELRNLICASFFHDFNHSGSNKKDSHNIALSIGAFSDFYNNYVVDLFTKSKIDFNLVITLIQQTEFPYRTDFNLTNLHLILRDADMCQLFEYDILYTSIFGLSEELKIKKLKRLDDQINFIQTISFNTNYAKEMWQKLKESKLKEFELLKKIIN